LIIERAVPLKGLMPHHDAREEGRRSLPMPMMMMGRG